MNLKKAQSLISNDHNSDASDRDIKLTIVVDKLFTHALLSSLFL